MAKILLDYVFPITVITPTPAASTAFMKQACVVAKPKSGQEGNVGQVFECTSMTQVAARTDNTNAQQLFNAGMSKVYILLSDTLDLEEALATQIGKFYTLLVSDDFTDADVETGLAVVGQKASLKVQDITYTAVEEGEDGNDISVAYIDDQTAGNETVAVVGTAITVHIEAGVTTAQDIADLLNAETDVTDLVTLEVDAGDEDDVQAAAALDNLEGGVDEVASEDGLQVGVFTGVIGVSSSDTEYLAEQAIKTNRVAFFGNNTNKAKNMFYAFGKLLSNASSWLNQQYISMPFDDGVDELGEANSLFDSKISFVIADSEFSTRLALFAVEGKAIVAPYIEKNLGVDLQSRTLQWISANQPGYTIKEASLLETRLQQDVIDLYISTNQIASGAVVVSLEEDNFVAKGEIDIAQPKAMWRVFSEIRETI